MSAARIVTVDRGFWSVKQGLHGTTPNRTILNKYVGRIAFPGFCFYFSFVLIEIHPYSPGYSRRPFYLESVRHASRNDRVPLFAAAVAHEFNEELMLILNHADVALERLGPRHPARSFVIELENAAQRCATITQGLQAFSVRGGDRPPQTVALMKLIAES